MSRKWWIISDEDIQKIRQALFASTHEANSYNCQDWPPGNGCSGCDGDELRKKARHTLDSGLHTTEAVPSDYQCPECGAELDECVGEQEGKSFAGVRCPKGCNLSTHYC